MTLWSNFTRTAVTGRLRALTHGRIELVEGDMVSTWGGGSGAPLRLVVHDPRFYGAVMFGGAVGAGEAYGDGWWSTPDLTALVRLLLRDRAVLDGMETGWARVAQPIRRAVHALRANTRSGSRRNIEAHYDLSNAFFAQLLDESLTYSCAVFDRPDATLAEAQEAKYARMAALVDLRHDDHLLEIGTGWGGFAIHAARTTGCRVTTTTISDAQYRLAQDRVVAAGVADRVTILKQDYRDLTGTYDKLVSIEMIEAVGHEHFDTFFRTVAARLAPHGRAAIQAIVIDDARYESARREVDFIKRHIFPGSCIPSREVLRERGAAAGLKVARSDEIGIHYAETLRRWRQNLTDRREGVEQLGFDAHFQRMWEFYLCYCEGGFLEQAIGAVQLVFTPQTAWQPVAAKVPPVPRLEVAA